MTLCQIRESALSVDDVLAAVADPSAGGTCVFIGTIRDHDHDRAVRALEYSHHPGAEQVAHELAERLDAAGRVARLALVHRVGRLEIGDIAVVCAVSAAHRGAAFEVCRELIDELKATVPIWKHQKFADGADEWVGLP